MSFDALGGRDTQMLAKVGKDNRIFATFGVEENSGIRRGDLVGLTAFICRERHFVECFIDKIQHFCRVAARYDKTVAPFFGFVAIAAFIAEAITDLLAIGRRSMRLARLAETLPAINWLQTVGSLERQHPPWILRGKSADLIQLPKLVLSECEFDRREIVLKLVEAFRANDDRGYHRLRQMRAR